MTKFNFSELDKEVIEEPKDVIDVEQIEEALEDAGFDDGFEEFLEMEEATPEEIQPEMVKKAEAKIKTKTKQLIPSFIMLFNGRHGSGKTTAAELFPTPFIMDCERGKDMDAIPYSNYEQIRSLRVGTMEDIKKNKTNIDVVDIQDTDPETMWSNIQDVIDWYIKIGYKNHRTFIIGKGFTLRKTRGLYEEKKKGRRISKFEWRPVTESEQEEIYKLIEHCRKHNLNLINISHWGYKDAESERSPDVKEWIEQQVTWRIDFLKPEESGYKSRYIVYLDKAPKYQYSYLDITDKSLFEIINDLDTFSKEVEVLKQTESEDGFESGFGGEEV